MDAEHREYARRLHDDRDPGAVVGGAVAGDPTIEVGAGHDVAGFRLAAGDVREDIVGVVVGVLEVGDRLDAQAHFPRLREAREPPKSSAASSTAGSFGVLPT